MGSDKRIGATDDAADGMRALGSYDPGVPGGAEMRVVQGVKDGPAIEYVDRLKRFGLDVSNELEKQLRWLQKDCEDAARAISELHELDEEIAAMLNAIETGTESASVPRGTPAESASHASDGPNRQQF